MYSHLMPQFLSPGPKYWQSSLVDVLASTLVEMAAGIVVAKWGGKVEFSYRAQFSSSYLKESWYKSRLYLLGKFSRSFVGIFIDSEYGN